MHYELDNNNDNEIDQEIQKESIKTTLSYYRISNNDTIHLSLKLVEDSKEIDKDNGIINDIKYICDNVFGWNGLISFVMFCLFVLLIFGIFCGIDIIIVVIAFNNSRCIKLIENDIIIKPKTYAIISGFFGLYLFFSVPINFIYGYSYGCKIKKYDKCNITKYDRITKIICGICRCFDCLITTFVFIWSIIGFVIYDEMKECKSAALSIVILIWSIIKMISLCCYSCCACIAYVFDIDLIAIYLDFLHKNTNNGFIFLLLFWLLYIMFMFVVFLEFFLCFRFKLAP